MSYTSEELSVKIDYIEKDIEIVKRELKDFSEVKTQLKMLGQTVDTLANTVQEDNKQVNENIKQLTKTIELQSKMSQDAESKRVEFKNSMENRIRQLEEKEANEALKRSQDVKKKIMDYLIKGIACLLLLGAGAWISDKVNVTKGDDSVIVKEYNSQENDNK